VCPRGYEEDGSLNPKVMECLHISELFDHAAEFDLIHNNFDYLPLTYSGLVATPVITTIHGFSSPAIVPVYKKYNHRVSYVSISNADRSPELAYEATIYHGIDLAQFTFREKPEDYLLFFGRFHHDKGAKEAIEIARACGRKLILAGIIQSTEYFERYVEPYIDGEQVVYLGPAGPRERDELLGGASAMLHPINFDEPFGLSVDEAMACGTPTIAINRGSMPELIQDGKTGFLVPDAKGCIEAVQRVGDIDRRECRRAAEKRFTADRMVEQYMSIYENVLSRHKVMPDSSRGLARHRSMHA
jgi:glycosyltransferase involved in cell wall biosynthesis